MFRFPQAAREEYSRIKTMKPFSATRSKRLAWAIGLAVAAVTAVLIHNWAAPRIDSEPSPEDCLENGDSNDFKRMGTRGIRFLTDKLGTKTLLEQHQSLFYKLPVPAQALIAAHYGPRPFARQQRAAEILLALGPDAAPGVPAISKILQDPESGWIKEYCVEILGAIGPKAASSLSVLLAATTNNDSTAQAAAAALWKISRRTDVLVNVISNRLRFSGRERSSVLPYFANLGDALKPAAPVIEHALFDQDESVRCWAEKILGKIEPGNLNNVRDAVNHDADRLLASHIKALRSANAEDRRCALNAVRVFGPAASNAVPTLVSMLETYEAELSNSPTWSGEDERDACIAAIAEIGPAASSAAPALSRLLRPRRGYFNDNETALVCRALGRLGSNATEAIPTLNQLLTNGMALTDGPAGRDPRLHRQIHNPLEAVAYAAALAQIAPNDPTAGAALHTLRTNLSNTAALAASVALWRIGSETNLPVEELAAVAKGFLNSSVRNYRFPAAYSDLNPTTGIDMIGDIGPPARGALPELEKHLDPVDPLRRAAAIAIQKIDPETARRLGLPGLLIVCPQ
jgi:HEAT repeat protein